MGKNAVCMYYSRCRNTEVSEVIWKNEIWYLQSLPGDTAWNILNFKVCESRIYWPLEFCPIFLVAKLFVGFAKGAPLLPQIFKSHLSKESSVICFSHFLCIFDTVKFENPCFFTSKISIIIHMIYL